MGLPSSMTVDLWVERSQEVLSETGSGQLCCFRTCILLLASSWLFNHLECSAFLRVNNTQKGPWAVWRGEGLRCPMVVTRHLSLNTAALLLFNYCLPWWNISLWTLGSLSPVVSQTVLNALLISSKSTDTHFVLRSLIVLNFMMSLNLLFDE